MGFCGKGITEEKTFQAHLKNKASRGGGAQVAGTSPEGERVRGQSREGERVRGLGLLLGW